ncbi:hypothetical protein C0J52_08990 [Blattella germanica]|nr:hypothetical protein C0J52_08990 [Blattella germanica]
MTSKHFWKQVHFNAMWKTNFSLLTMMDALFKNKNIPVHFATQSWLPYLFHQDSMNYNQDSDMFS